MSAEIDPEEKDYYAEMDYLIYLEKNLFCMPGQFQTIMKLDPSADREEVQNLTMRQATKRITKLWGEKKRKKVRWSQL